MLRSLLIQNYALIDSLEVDFGKGLTIVTGETGAGKSIILGALSLLMGARADSRSVRDNARKSVVEAEFTGIGENVSEKLNELGIENNGESLVLRREITSTGRSRTLINDSAVTLAEMWSVASFLIDIHSQHKNLAIGDGEYRLSVLDAIGDTRKELEEYKKSFRRFVKARSIFRETEERARKAEREDSIIRFQLEQLNSFAPRKGEQESLERRFEMLESAEDIRERLSSALTLLSPGEENSASGKIDRAIGDVDRLPSDFFEESDGNPVERLRNISRELRDISTLFEERFSGVSGSPGELEKINTRLDELYRLQLSFKVESEDELVSIHESLKEQIRLSDTASTELPGLEKEMRAAAGILKQSAQRLTEARLKAASAFSSSMEEYGVRLGLKNIRFKVEVLPAKLTPAGGDTVNFLCSFNKNSELRPVEKIASGGEVSRLMLSLKSILAGRMELPTIIFDEIDAGVSGEIADRMGEMMRDISDSIQVITITHLPQVAAKGDAHLKVYKSDSESETFTRIMPLDKDGREQELARLLSGANVNEAALMNARQLLNESGL